MELDRYTKSLERKYNEDMIEAIRHHIDKKGRRNFFINKEIIFYQQGGL